LTAAGPVALALHGGAGRRVKPDYERERLFAAELAGRAWRDLADGCSALDVVAEAVRALELSGFFMAGRGARPGGSGLYELDAAIMDGPTRRAGAVAALQGFQSPISVAREVMTHTPHVLLAGAGAADFARGRGLAGISDEAAWYVGADACEPDHGTVGCVALDGDGRMAAATSTAGVRDKLWGRVGDSPLIGAGTWADQTAAISCTGLGEAFIRASAASQLAFRMRLAGQALAPAADAVLDEVEALGGRGGLIALNRDGAVVTPFNAQFMALAAVGPDGQVRAAC